MGIQFCFSSKPIMKSLLLVALAFAAAVVAEPEADAAADAWYGYYGYPGYYGLGYYGRRWGGYYGYPYRGYYGLWKRDAEAEPTAAANPDADAAADACYGYYGYRPWGYYGYSHGCYARPYGYYGRYYGRYWW